MDKESNDILKFGILSFYSESQKLLQGEFPNPRMVIFHPTYLCNYNCPGCEFAKQNKWKAMLTKAQIDRLFDQFVKAKLKSIEFSGGGEPLLHPDINYMLLKAHSLGFAFGVLTNGSKLEGELLESIIKFGSHLRISMESGTPQTFLKARGIKDKKEFDRVVSNISNAVALRSKLKSDIEIRLKITIGEHNCNDIEEAIKLAIKLVVDSVQFKMYRNVDVMIKDSKDLENKLQALKEKYKGKIPIFGDLKQTSTDKKCWLAPIQMAVDAFGDVYACSYYRHRMDSHKIGNLLKEEFDDLWFSKKHKQLMQNIKISECNVYDCRFHSYNNLMENLLQKNNKLLDFI